MNTFGLVVAGIGVLVAFYNPANLRVIGLTAIPVGLIMAVLKPQS
tara:strand:+ start:664 stop:798 length:135 start_codon:yes stop_codon:yes gene_type:complete